MIGSKQIEDLFKPALHLDEKVGTIEKPEETPVLEPEPQQPETVMKTDPPDSISEIVQEEHEDFSAERDEEAIDDAEVDVPVIENIVRDNVFDVDTVEKTVIIPKNSRRKIRREFRGLLKANRLNLKKRLEKVEKTEHVKKKKKEILLKTGNVDSLLKTNRSIFYRNRVTPKWKHYAMNKTMERQYLPKVNEAIKPYWNLPWSRKKLYGY